MRRLLPTVTLLAAATIAQPAVAGTPSAQGPAPADIARAKLIDADANKDSKWNKAEWLAAGRREMGFAFCDTNKDDLVDQAELKSCAEKARAMGMTTQ